eukprot:Gb_10073 [translate_table: standard]
MSFSNLCRTAPARQMRLIHNIQAHSLLTGSQWPPSETAEKHISSQRLYTRSTPYRGNKALGFPLSCAFSAAAEEKKFRFEEYCLPLIGEVNAALDKAMPITYPEKIHEAMRYSIFAGGKRVCPIMCIATCELVGASRDRALPVACALEMIHTASLIQDDLPCMDNDPLRRGRPANHVIFGEHVAILAGDALLSLAFEHVIGATEGVPAEKVLRAVYEISKVMGSKGMAGGQLVDLMSAGKEEADASVVEYIHLHKSAVIAECSLVGGAVVGGASDEEVESLRKYGRNVGLMYQIMDDILDVSESSQQLGKTAGKDEGADKATYPKVFGIRRSRQIVEDLKMSAKECLCGFDPNKAAPLLCFVDYVATRHS